VASLHLFSVRCASSVPLCVSFCVLCVCLSLRLYAHLLVLTQPADKARFFDCDGDGANVKEPLARLQEVIDASKIQVCVCVCV
jgi:hypothetical protein